MNKIKYFPRGAAVNYYWGKMLNISSNGETMRGHEHKKYIMC
jgi:hypothetical protein